MRLVLDTNIVISALLWNGAPSRLFGTVAETNTRLFTSAAMLSELNTTFRREKFEKIIAKTGRSSVGWVSIYKGICEIVVPDPVQPIAPDPDDDWVIATALAAEADLIVTGDKPFLGVGAVGNVRIVGVIEALELLKVR
jgi:uncharacterized protein